MKHFTTIGDIDNPALWIEEALALKKDQFINSTLGSGKTLGLLFFNNSLRTRVSTQLAARNLGLNTVVMNFGEEGWQLEVENGIIMNGNPAEHIKEAAAVMGRYCDIIGIRAFAGLVDKEYDLKEPILKGFKDYSGVPILNLESSLAHPLQALADGITISEYKSVPKPRVVLSWAPHPKALPHAVANSFVQFMRSSAVDLCITHPEGYELDPEITGDCPILYNQDEALQDADFVYAKNWSSFSEYGKVLNQDPGWMITQEKLKSAYFMHCLPVRRNVVVSDHVLDGPNSLVLEQAENRTYAAQVVLQKILQSL